MNDSNTSHPGNRKAMRRWFAVSLLVGTGVMVKVADAGELSSSLIAEGASVFVPITPQRILDTRPAPNGPIGVPTSAKIGSDSSVDLAVAGAGSPLPAEATAAMINITVDQDAPLQSFITVWPKGEPRPLTSANNAEPGLIVANSMIAKLGADGGISVYNQQGSVNVVIDVVGYLVPAAGAGGSVLLVGDGPPSADMGTEGDYYLDGSTHILYGPLTGGVWPVPGSDLDGLPGGVSRYNTGGQTVPNVTTAGTPIPFLVAGPVFGSFAPPTTPATTTTFTVGETGIFEVFYRLDITSTGIGTVQIYNNDAPQGSGNDVGAAVATQAFDTVMFAATAGDQIQLRFTGTVGVLTLSTSSIVITQVS